MLMVGSSAYSLPLPEGLSRKWGSVADRVDVRIIGQAGSVAAQDPRFRLVRVPRHVAGIFHLVLPWIVLREARRFRPDVVVTQSPYEALPILAVRRFLPGRPKLVVEVHGDWRTATRSYGSPIRRLFSGASDRVAGLALRHADGTRAIGSF